MYQPPFDFKKKQRKEGKHITKDFCFLLPVLDEVLTNSLLLLTPPTERARPQLDNRSFTSRTLSTVYHLSSGEECAGI